MMLAMSSAARALPPRRATYADVEAAPANQVAELIRGALHVMPRPALRHARASSALGMDLGGPFDRGRGGPGGWIILDEVELHFPDPTEDGAEDVLVPDLAGWQRARVPELPDTAFTTIAPDWICEVVSPSTRDFDRDEKMPVYAREGVRWAWLLDPIAKTLEVYTLNASGRWGEAEVFHDVEMVRAVPFDAIELELSALWA